MSRVMPWLMALGAMLTLASSPVGRAQAPGATIVREGDAYRIRAPKYEAIVASDGALTHLRVGNGEFLKPGVGISRGTYFYQNGALKLPTVTLAAPNVLSAKGDVAAIRYEFGADAMTWTVGNASDAAMNFFLVLDAGVRAGRNEAGAWAAFPATGPWSKATIFRDRTRLEIGGTTRVWGPWEANLQVLETALAPRETRTLIFKVADATNEEIAKVTEIAKAAETAANKTMEDADLTVLSPRPYQVFQRQTRTRGEVLFSGRIKPDCDVLEARLFGKAVPGATEIAPWTQWRALPLQKLSRSFGVRLPVPAGGWYRVELRARKGKDVVAQSTVENVGVGEIFVGAGQSNSTNSGGEGRLATATKMVSTFSGNEWKLADDPQPGAHDKSGGGSFWPAFGDAMFARYQVPIGVAVTGHGGTSVNAWQPDGELFGWMMTRIHQLGPQGFRGVLWHQGESDVGQTAEAHAQKMTTVIRASKERAGWEFPWFVAQVSYHNPEAPSFPTTREAQQKLWQTGIAWEGPDTDTLGGDNRDGGGKGIHFSPKGLTTHGKMWADKVALYLDRALTQ